MRLAPLIMTGVAVTASVGGVGLWTPSWRGRARSAPNRQGRRIAGVMLLAVAAILSIFALALAGLTE